MAHTLKPRRFITQFAVEAVERRLLLANLVWTNRGLASDNFAATFGAGAAAARSVVDAVITHWERVIDDFNWASATQFNLQIQMRSQAAPDFGGQTSPATVTIDGNGVPTSAVVNLGRGTDTSGDGLGDGVGWWIDPTPNDFAEFDTPVSGFVGNASAGPATGGRDFYSLVAHEIGHGVGMTSNATGDWRTRLPLFATQTAVADAGGAGLLWAYNSASVGRVVLTDSDLAGSGSTAVHMALVNQTFNFNGQTYTSARDVMNNTFSGAQGRRHLISNVVVGMLDDVYGYDTTWPEQFGSMYTSLDTSTGILTLRGGAGGSNDTFSITSQNGGYTISVNVGNDIPGTGPTDAFQSTWTDAQVNGIVVDAGDGNDFIDVRVIGANEPVTVNAGTGNDTVNLGIGDFDTNLGSNVTVNGGTGTDSIRINDLVDGINSDSYTITTATISKPTRSADYTSIERLDIDASDQNDVFHIESIPSTMSLSIDGGLGNDSFRIAEPAGDLDSIAGPSTLLGGTGDDSLFLFDGSDTGDDNYLFDGASLNFTKNTGAFGGILQSSFALVQLDASDGSNTLIVDQFFPATFGVDMAAGNDTIVLGNGDLDNIASGLLDLSGGSGTDSLRLLDAGDTLDDTYVFDRNAAIGLFGKVGDQLTVQYVQLESLSLAANNQANVIRVEGLALGVDLSVAGNLGGDSLYLGDGDIDSNVLGQVAFDGFSNGRVFLLDASDGIGSDSYLLQGGTFSKGGSVKLTFSNVSFVDLECSAQNDVISIGGTFGYPVSVRAGDGDDTITLGSGDLAFMDDVTLFGGNGVDELAFNDTTASVGHNLLVDQTGGLPFLSAFSGNILFLYDSIARVTVNAGPLNDTLTSINVPQLTTLRINANGGDDLIDVQGHRTVNNAILARVTITSGGGNDTLQVDADSAGNGAYVAIVANESLATLNIGTDGDVRLDAGNLLLEVTSSTVFSLTNAELDLCDGRFVRRTNPNLSFFQTRLTSGYNNGSWDGNGIQSTTAAATPGRALGYARGSDLFNGGGGVTLGINLAAADLLIAYTAIGDANLDRNVNFDELLKLAQNYGTANRLWSDGNLNYDAGAAVNFDDLLLMAQHYGTSLAGVSAMQVDRISPRRNVQQLLQSA